MRCKKLYVEEIKHRWVPSSL